MGGFFMHARVLRLQTQHTGMHKKPTSENHLYPAATGLWLPFCTTLVRAILTAVKSKQYDDFRTENRSIPSILETEMLVRVRQEPCPLKGTGLRTVPRSSGGCCKLMPDQSQSLCIAWIQSV